MRPDSYLRRNSSMILMFLVDLVDLQNLQDRLAYHQDDLQLYHRQRKSSESTSRERLPLRPSPPEPQLVPIPVNGGDGAKHTKIDNGDGPDRVSEFSLMRKFHRNHKLNL